MVVNYDVDKLVKERLVDSYRKLVYTYSKEIRSGGNKYEFIKQR